MTNYEKYVNVYVETFEISKEVAETLKYMQIQEWDSVGHMGLMSAMEETFGIEMEADDIIDFSSFEKGKEILSRNYGIEF
jgi:acyl carrier protein